MCSVIPDLYDFLLGPGFFISIIVFTTGLFFRLFQLTRATHKIRTITIDAENHTCSIPSSRGVINRGKIISSIKIKLINTIFGTNPVMSVISLVFHILLFITPLFLAAHNIIADLTIGVSFFTIPEGLSDVFTIVIISIGGFFLARRILIPRVRIISTVRDYFLLIIVLAPFVSGFLAYHQFFNYRVVIFAHMIIGEISIMAVPFTGLVHMPFTFFFTFFY